MSLSAASKFKALTCIRRSKGVIKRPGLTGSNTIVHVQCRVVHLIHRHMLHTHPHWYHHELVSHLPHIRDDEVVRHSGSKGGQRRIDLVVLSLIHISEPTRLGM